jgi:hypothetical protein
MKLRIIIPFAVILVVSLFFIGEGITGWVVSETCSFDPVDGNENLCEVTRQLEAPAEINHGVLMYFGGILMMIAVLVYALGHKHIH